MAHTEHVKHIGQSLAAIGNFIEMMGQHEGKRCHFFVAVWVDGVVQYNQNTPDAGVAEVLAHHLTANKIKGPAA